MWLSGKGCGQEGRGCQSPGSRPQGLAVLQTGDREASSHGPPLDAHCVTRTSSCFPLKRWSQWDAAREGEHWAWKHQGGRGGHAACPPSASGLHCHPLPTRPGSPRGAGSEWPRDGCPVSRNEQTHPGRSLWSSGQTASAADALQALECPSVCDRRTGQGPGGQRPWVQGTHSGALGRASLASGRPGAATLSLQAPPPSPPRKPLVPLDRPRLCPPMLCIPFLPPCSLHPGTPWCPTEAKPGMSSPLPAG